MVAVAVGVPGQVLLVVLLGVIERAGVDDLGGDLAEAARRQRSLVPVPRRQRLFPLGLTEHIDAAAVLAADVVALAHALGGVVHLPEHLQQLLIRRHRRVVHHQHHLVVAGAPGAHLLVGGVGGHAPRVADRGGVHPLHLPEEPLGAPEAPHPEHGPLAPVGERRHKRGAEHQVSVGLHLHGLGPPRQGVGGGRHPGLVASQQHDPTVQARLPGSRGGFCSYTTGISTENHRGDWSHHPDRAHPATATLCAMLDAIRPEARPPQCSTR